MINVTDKAIEKVKGFLEQEKASLPGGGLRIFVQGGGCSGVSYGMVLDEAAAGDEGLDPPSVDALGEAVALLESFG